MPTLNHLHTYERIRRNKNRYRCIHPRCTHFSTKELIIGKSALCTLCQNEFILDAYALSLKSPRCEKCRRRKVKYQEKKVTPDILKELGLDL